MRAADIVTTRQLEPGDLIAALEDRLHQATRDLATRDAAILDLYRELEGARVVLIEAQSTIQMLQAQIESTEAPQATSGLHGHESSPSMLPGTPESSGGDLEASGEMLVEEAL